MRWLLIAFAASAVTFTIVQNSMKDDEAGLFELAVIHPSGKGYRLTTRREFTSRKECEGLAKQLSLTTYSEWRCNAIKEIHVAK